MPDNIGPYITYPELIAELFEDGSNRITGNESTTLSNKTVDVGGDIYEYTGGTPQLYDVVYQSGEIGLVIETLSAPTRVRVELTGAENTIANGSAKFLRSSQFTKRRADSLIKDRMAFIDRATRQFFNARSGEYFIEGNNTPLLLLPVPIITLETLEINSTSTILYEGEDRDFVTFRGRESPADDRYNPRVKLNVGRGRDSIFVGPVSNRVFARSTLTKVPGTFGFLEPDGSTPEPIKRAMRMLIFQDLNKPLSATGGTSQAEAGPLRRTKVDLHEKEFFASPAAERNKSAGLISGIHEVDIILAQYRSPLMLSGSFPRFKGQSNESGKL